MENKQNMAKTEQNKVITWEEVEKHKTKESRWLVIEWNVYDVTAWQGKHPGGARILGHFGGQDATVRKLCFCFVLKLLKSSVIRISVLLRLEHFRHHQTYQNFM